MAKYITIRHLASQLEVPPEELVLKLREMGIQVLDPSDTIDRSRVGEIELFLKGEREREEGVELKEIVGKDGKVVVRRRRRKKAEKPAEVAVGVEEEKLPTPQPSGEQEALREAVEAEPGPAAGAPSEGEVGAGAQVEERQVGGEEREAVAPGEEQPEAKKRGRPEKTAPERPEKRKPVKRIPIRGRLGEPAKVISRPKHPTPPPMAPKPKPSDMTAHKPHRKVIEIVSERGRTAERPSGMVMRRPGPDLRLDRRERKELREERKRAKRREREDAARAAAPKVRRPLKLPAEIVVADLVKEMGVKASEIIKKLLELGVMATINQAIDFDTAAVLASEFGFEVESSVVEEKDVLPEEEDRPEDLEPRSPVVTVMGHVDHGKTTLLDSMRRTNVADKEVGGITQHIGASVVERGGKKIVFVDTPGHEAFTAMRARGAQVTDIVVLVVAADDGVMPQTVEAIDHARAANVPIIVSINKIDKSNANPETVKKQLADKGLVPEEWGGDTLYASVSAKLGEGVEELLDLILLQAEVLDLKANPKKRGKGYILESRVEKGRGPVAVAVVRDGSLKVGDVIVAGPIAGRVRAMFDSRGRKLSEAGPSTPVEVVGLEALPEAGDLLEVMPEEKTARQITAIRDEQGRSAETRAAVSLEDLYEKIQAGEVKELNLVIKADVQGSAQALQKSLSEVGAENVKPKIVHAAVGMITETDVNLAVASDAIIIGFNVRPDTKAAKLAKREGVEIKLYSVIYDVIDDVKKALSGLLEPEYEEEVLGRLEVRQVFKVPKIGTIAGSYVKDGKVVRGARARLIREGVVVFDTRIASLKRFKDDVKEVAQGYECGVGLENYQDIKVEDEIEVYEVKEIKPAL